MKKRILSLLIVLCLMCGMIPAVSAADVASGTCGENLTWVLTDNGTLTISGEGHMWDYSSSSKNAPWYDHRSSITTLVVEEGIKGIGQAAFYDCSEITNISLPNTLTHIRSLSFAGCSASGELVIPNSVISISSNAFNDCGLESIVFSEGFDPTYCSSAIFENSNNLEKVTFGYGITEISYEMFKGCQKLKEVILPDSVTTIEGYAFRNCDSLESIVLPNGINKLGPGVFMYCDSLATVNLPDELTDIPTSIFKGCISLTQVTIPKQVSYISSDAFSECSALHSFIVPENNMNYSSNGGALYNKDQTQLLCIPEGIHGFYSIVDGVTTICRGAVRNFEGLKCIGIPKTVTVIEEAAFARTVYDSNSAFNVYYSGTAEQWTELQTDEYWNFNEGLWYATVHYNSTDPDSHPYAKVETHASCTEQGYTTYTCSCGHSYVSDYVDPLGHNYSGGICTRCDEVDPDYVPVENPFTDVTSSDYYYEPVRWAVDEGITSGITPTEFSPYDSCLRAQVVTFLWRAAGEPKAESKVNPFVDVKPTDYYYDAVLWAVENGITTGADSTHFEPNAVCNRSQVVTFLYRAFEKPSVEGTENPFTDISNEDWYAAPVLWAVREGITKGLSETVFGPNDVCDRSQVVTFLYRAYN